VQAVERGDFARAAHAFEAADRVRPHPTTAFNAALAWQSAGDRVRAAEDFAIALGRGLRGAQEVEARKRLASLETNLARVELTGPSGSTVKVDDEDLPLPVTRYELPGEATFTVRLSDGRIVSRRAVMVVGTKSLLDFTEVAPPSPPVAAPRSPQVEATTEPRPRWAGWLTLGAGVALVGGGVAVGLAGLAARDSFAAGGRRDPGTHDEAVTLRTWSNVLWIGGAAAGAIGIAVLLWPTRAKHPTTTLRVGPGIVGLHAEF
jgi:hypothetical protein